MFPPQRLLLSVGRLRLSVGHLAAIVQSLNAFAPARAQTHTHTRKHTGGSFAAVASCWLMCIDGSVCCPFGGHRSSFSSLFKTQFMLRGHRGFEREKERETRAFRCEFAQTYKELNEHGPKNKGLFLGVTCQWAVCSVTAFLRRKEVCVASLHCIVISILSMKRVV